MYKAGTEKSCANGALDCRGIGKNAWKIDVSAAVLNHTVYQWRRRPNVSSDEGNPIRERTYMGIETVDEGK